MSDIITFLKAGLKNPLHIGAIAPSSTYLAAKMLHDLPFTSGKSVLELGVGTGPFTEALYKILPPDIPYLGIEKEANFMHVLEKRYPNFHFVCGDAGEALALHQMYNLPAVNCILSGLPFGSLPQVVRTAILDAVDGFMEKGCVFRNFQYVHAYNLPPAVAFRARMNEKYGQVQRSKVILRNLPPAFTLTWNTL